jgi:alpha-D-ribose 1-methylphosphonate 5-triphosphate diphosphatase PhnM
MLAGWSLRTRLVVVVTIALLPVLALSAWNAVREPRASELRRTEAVAAAAEVVVARHRELLEATRRLLVAMCEEDAVRLSANPDASAGDINRCEAYLGQVLQKFPTQYSSAFVTDAAGTARCASAPTAVGMGFGDREVFRQVRETR